MSAVEDRIVSMKFDNSQFEPAVTKTVSTLDRLKTALNFGGQKSDGLDEIQNKANRFSLAGMTSQLGGISGKFMAMSAVAVTAIANIVNRAVDAGLRIAKSLTIAPVMDGFHEYETQLNSVQTILSNTKAAGSSLKDVNSTLNELNHYSDQTIYNFSEMARNIGTFTAAGVDLKTSAASIKGIANLAALSGSNSQQASSAMYQLSQAISAGRVGLQDWNSVVNAGMGGTVFQRALAQTAEQMGTLGKGSVKLSGDMKNATINGKSFRESITAKPGQDSWLTSDVLTTTLKQFTGDMSDAELASMGFSKAQIKSIQDQAATAFHAAQDVKTLSQLMGTLQEAAGSGWAQTSQIIFGDFEEAKKLFTAVSNVVGTFIQNSANARNKMLQDWKDLGGRTKLIDGLTNVFKGVVSVIKPIGDAFRQIFPATTGKQLLDLTQAFLDFSKKLTISNGTAEKIGRTFAGVFAVLDIGWQIVKAIANVFGELFGFLAGGSGDFLTITQAIGDWLVNLDEAIKKGDVFNKFFQKMGDILAIPVAALKALAGAIKAFFSNLDVHPLQAFMGYFGSMGDRLSPLGAIISAIAKAFGGLAGVFAGIGKFLKPAIDGIVNAFSSLGSALASSLKTGDFSGVYDALNTGLLAGIVLIIRNFLKKGINVDLGGGIFGQIKEAFEGLTGVLGAMQQQIQAKTIMNIAIAVAVLVGSLFLLSTIDSKKLTNAMAALGVAMGYLMGAMAVLTQVTGTSGFLKIPSIAAAMIALSIAVLILAASVKILSGLSWGELIKGLLGVGVLMVFLVGASQMMSKNAPRMLAAGLAMIPFAIGIKILASAVQDLGELPFGTLVKGLLALAVGLKIISSAMTAMPANMAVSAVGLLITAAALKIMASAMADFGGMSMAEIGKSLLILAVSLALLAAALIVMEASLPGAAALIVAAAGLAILAPALKMMGEMDMASIGKAMLVLFGALLLLALGLTAMIVALPGAAALVVAAAALTILVPVLMLLGAMTWTEIFTGLTALALALGTLATAALLMIPVIVPLMLLSTAIVLLGAGLALTGVGLLAIATAFTIFTAAGTAGIVVLGAMAALLPVFATNLAMAVVAFVVSLAAGAVQIVAAFVTLGGALLMGIVQLAPQLTAALGAILNVAISVIGTYVPKLVGLGVRLIVSLLLGINSSIGIIVAIAGNIIIRFINGISAQLGGIINAGTNLIIKFMQGISNAAGRLMQAAAKLIIDLVNKLASTIRSNQSAMNTAGRNLASAIISGMTGGLSDKVGQVARAAANMAKSAYDAAKHALGINSPSRLFRYIGEGTGEGMVLGMDRSHSSVQSSAANMAKSAFTAVQSSMSKISDSFAVNSDMNPTISPVLDLTNVTKDAGQIGSLLGKQSVSANVSASQAQGVSQVQQQTAADTAAAVAEAAQPKDVSFTQVINAPKQPSAIELYRNTRNLISMATEAMTA